MVIYDDAGARKLLGQGKSLELLEEVKDNTRAFVLSKVYGEGDDVTCGFQSGRK